MNVGDLVEFKPDAVLLKLQQTPLDVMKQLADRANPRYDFSRMQPEEAPIDSGHWIISDLRSLFTPHGRRVKIFKITNILTNTSGWIPEVSLQTTVSAT